MNSLKSKLVYQLVSTFFLVISPLILFPYISRVLGPENLGKLNFIDYTSQFIISFTSFGIPIYGIREVARYRNQKAKLKKIVSELLLIHFITTLLGIIVFVCLVFFNRSFYLEKWLIVLALINILISAFSLEWFVQGMEDFAFQSKRLILIKLISIIAVFFFIKNSADYTVYYLILIAAAFAIFLADFQYVFKRIAFSLKGISLRPHLKPLFFFFLTTVAISLYTYLDTIIVGLVSGSLAVGFYTTGLKVIRLSQNFVDSVGAVLLPRISFLHQTSNHAEIERIINKSLHYVLTVSVPVCILFFLLAHEIVLVLSGNKYFPSIDVLKILSILPLLIGLSNIFGMQILLPFREEKTMLRAVLIGSIVSITTNLLLCPLYSAKGAAIATVITELAVTLTMLYAINKRICLHWNKSLFYNILTCCLFIPVVYFCRMYFPTSLSILLASGLISIAAFISIQYFLKNQIILDLISYSKTLLLKKNTIEG